MKIGIGSDHAGYYLKEDLKKFLEEEGFEVVDFGTNDPSVRSDYPDIAAIVSKAVVKGEVYRGIIICGSGVGACIAANKIRGIRAGLCHDTYSAHQGVEHDDMNVLCLGARIIGVELAKEIVKTFLRSSFVPQERYIKRLEKVKKLEEER